MLIKIDQNWAPRFEEEYKDILSTDNRRVLLRTSNVNKANLSMYAKSLFSKGCLIKNVDGGTEVNPILMPEPVGDIVEYNFVLDMRG